MRALAGVVVGLALMGTVVRAAERGQAVLELRVVTHAALDSADLEIAKGTAKALLARAGIEPVWRECALLDACSGSAASRVFVLVHLFPTLKSSAPSISGESMRAPGTGIPVALVYVRRTEELVHELQRPSDARQNPALATLSAGHLVGLTIAHEVGHLLGLRHSSIGLMKPELTPGDVVALRSSSLGFLPEEGTRMRRVFHAEVVARGAASDWRSSGGER